MTNEPESTPQSIPAHDGASRDAAETTAPATSDTATTSVMNPNERFARGDEMQALYERMRPDQRTAVAGEFIRLLGLAGDDQARQFRQQFQRHTQIATDAKEELLSADEVATIDQYVRQKHPEMIEEMLRHPVTQSALEAPGMQASDEEDVPANKDKIMPTENVVTTGTGYVSGGVMMEEGGEPYNRMVEDPHELGAGPGGELEREQRAYEDEGEEAERPTDENTEQNL